ncbi:hypothetical protein GGP41_004185 [Bipolaris sorokiniana]|uniref:Uncharacterized protein n=1 Tax=Cochliobolus sativus TaxID=45130 RepID=A0A8H6DYM9_COCSA|nr:hypothetical protein GGP41_004185 [Bipolaris sorokiniana]
MSITRQITIQADGPTLAKLGASQFQLHVAKSVIGSDGQLFGALLTSKVTFNVVWQSKALQPFVDIKWTPEYGMNWTADSPQDGISVTIRGIWQACKPGQIFDLNAQGVWTKSASTPVKDFMAIGNNDFYTDDAPNGIHVIIGIKNKSGSFDPIFMNPTAMGKGMNATFQPQEQMQWWYAAGAKSATMFSNVSSRVETADFSSADPNTSSYKKQSSYGFEQGVWSTQAIA